MEKFSRETYPYSALFCEENIWQLASALTNTGIPREAMRVLFLCNRARQVLLFNQSAAAPGKSLLWDYHVILRVTMAGQSLIFDFDSRLPFPSLTHDYLVATLPHPTGLPPAYATTIRVIPADSYLNRFCSTRAHMVGMVAEEAFPPYPPISAVAGCQGIALSCYWDPDCHPDDGSRLYAASDYFHQAGEPSP